MEGGTSKNLVDKGPYTTGSSGERLGGSKGCHGLSLLVIQRCLLGSQDCESPRGEKCDVENERGETLRKGLKQSL